MSSSSRKISSESFSSSVGSDCGLESPGGDGGDGGLEPAEESRGCPFSSFPSSHRAVLWNGRSLAERSACPAGEEQQGPGGPHKRVTRRRRVNLDSLGESLRRLTSPTTQTVQEALQRTLQFYRQQEIRCQEVGSEERRREKREDKCPFLENSGSEEDVLQILQYMATILVVVADILLPSHILQLSGSRSVPWPDGIYSPCSMFWICPGISSQLDMPEIHPAGGVLEALVPRKASVPPLPPQLTAFNSKSSSSSPICLQS